MKQLLAFSIALSIFIIIAHFAYRNWILESEHYKDIQRFNQIERFLTEPNNLKKVIAE